MKKNNYLYIDFDDDDNDSTHQTRFKVSKTSRIENLINEKEFDNALIQIDEILEDEDNFTNWNLKGIILDNLNEYEKAIECFDKALAMNDSEEIKFNKAECLYNYAKITFFPEGNFDKALNLIDESLNILPEKEDPSEYYFLKAEILEGSEQLAEAQKAYLIAHKEFERLEEFEKQVSYLNNTADTLLCITGTNFYNFKAESGLTVDLVKDSENEHDPDAIAVLFDNEVVGYVANSEYTLIKEVNSASDIKHLINENQKAEILFDFLGEYTVAKLIN